MFHNLFRLFCFILIIACFTGAADGRLADYVGAHEITTLSSLQSPQWTTGSRLLKLGESIEFRFYCPDGVKSSDLIIFPRYLEQVINVAEYRTALSVILRDVVGLDADQTAEVLRTSRRTIFRDRSRICSQDDAPKKQWGGRRHCSMSVERELDKGSRMWHHILVVVLSSQLQVRARWFKK